MMNQDKPNSTVSHDIFCTVNCETFGGFLFFIEIKLLHLRAAEVSWAASDNSVSRSSKLVLLPLLNETRCGCECKNRLEGCNRFQVVH